MKYSYPIHDPLIDLTEDELKLVMRNRAVFGEKGMNPSSMEDSRLSSLSRLWYVAEFILLARAATKDGNKGDFIRWRTRARRIAAEVARDATLSDLDGGIPMLKFVGKALDGKRPPSSHKNFKILIWVAIYRQKFGKSPYQKELKDFADESGERLRIEDVTEYYQKNPKLPKGTPGKKSI